MTSVFGPQPARAVEKKAAINANFRIGCEARGETNLTSIRAFCTTTVAFCRCLALRKTHRLMTKVVKVAAAKLIGGKMRVWLGFCANNFAPIKWQAGTNFKPISGEYERYSCQAKCQTECPPVEPPDTAKAIRGIRRGGQRHLSGCQMGPGKRTEIPRLILTRTSL